jgi:hypothetical protein
MIKHFEIFHLKLITFFLVIIPFKSFSQINFEKGYFIDNSGKKTECYIKNADWKNNPVEFNYKLSIDGESKIATIDSIREFCVLDFSKYKRFSVEIDKSSDNISELSNRRNPQFNTEVLFLKVLLEGNTSLYLYNERSSTKFFYQFGVNAIVEQLIYKKYRSSDNRIGTNSYYKQQIINLAGQCIDKNYILGLEYSKRELIKCFTKLNTCTNSKVISFEKKGNKANFNFSIRPGLRISSLNVSYYTYSEHRIDYGSMLSGSLGFESELILPFNMNKWAISLEPTYQYYKSEDPRDIYPKKDVEYKSIELTTSLKYFFYLSNKSKVILNGGFILWDFPINSKIGNLSIDSQKQFHIRHRIQL